MPNRCNLAWQTSQAFQHYRIGCDRSFIADDITGRVIKYFAETAFERIDSMATNSA